MKRDFVDFKAIKAAVSIEQTLEHYGINWLRKAGDELRGRCPIHLHAEGERSFHVNVARSVFHCFSCGAKGGVLELVAALDKVSIREAGQKLQEWFLVGERTQKERSPQVVKSSDQPGKPKTINEPLKFRLQNVDGTHPYLAKRGINAETAEIFGVGYFPGKGSMSSRVVIPIANEGGEVIAYAGRSVDDSEPKYKFPAGFKKSLVVFNLHRVIERPTVILVEGFFDCMNVSQAGFPCVAIMGSALSQEQEDLLCKHFKQVVLCFDGDSAGKAATADSLNRLARRVFVKFVVLPDGSQPDMLPDDQIRELLKGEWG